MRRLHDLLAKSARAFPYHIALEEAGGRQATYEALYSRSDEIASILKTGSKDACWRIGILSQKRIEAVCAIFGILAAGSVYIPMDAEAPTNRNAFIIEDCALHAIILEAGLWSRYEEELSAAFEKTDALGDSGLLLLVRKNADEIDESDRSIANVLYTSGSTGMPKGVMTGHEQAMSFVSWANALLDLSMDDVFASIAPFHFDLSVFDLYVGIMNGAKILLLDAQTTRNPRMLSTLIDRCKITVWYSTPTLLKLMGKFGKIERFDHQSVRYVLFAGEEFQIAPLRQIKESWPTATFYNWYGPTETNVVTYFKIPGIIEDRGQPYPIGSPCDFAHIKLVGDSKMEQEGEIWVCGDTISPGYWNAEEKNTEQFVVDGAGVRWYKTGDWARIDEAGYYQFVGRKDRMVKRNGFRIELAEIEAALHRHPDLMDAAVAVKNLDEKIEICAYCQLKEKASKTLDVIGLQAHCLQYIPKYMLPDRFVSITEFPQTSTNKIDYQSLQKL